MQFLKYAQNNNCTVAKAIADRDWPMNKAQCVAAFIEATGNKPTVQEIIEMCPDGEKTIADENRLADWENFDLGRR